MKKTTGMHFIIKLLKISDEEKILKVAREIRHIIHRGKRNKHGNRFVVVIVFVGNNANKRQWSTIFKY